MGSQDDVKDHDWKTCPYCGFGYDRWCGARVVKSDVCGFPEEIEVKCHACGTVYQVQRLILWRLSEKEAATLCR